MAVVCNTWNAWAAGMPSLVKGGYRMVSSIDVVQNGDEADFVWHGTIYCYVQPYVSRNVWACSDFATFTVGDTPFTELDSNGTFYGWAYEHSMPWPGDTSYYGGTPIRGTGDFLLQVRVDTARSYNPNAVSVWTKDSGTVIDRTRNQTAGWGSVYNTDNVLAIMESTTASAQYNFSISFHMHLTQDPEQVVVFQNDSGASSSYDHSWYRRQPYIYIRDFINSGDIEFDYRPGERKIGGTWYSHNRDGGVCERNNSWYEMRTDNGDKGGTGNPPEVKRGGTWYNMKKIGTGA